MNGPAASWPILSTMARNQGKVKATKALGERALIEQIRRRSAGFAPSGLRLGIGDDCALLSLRPGEELAVTTDLSIAGRHFLLDAHPPQAVGHRTLARGLSDLAAMGARPLAAFLSLGLPRELTLPRGRGRSWVDGFLDGFMHLAESHGVPLAGGDLAESPLAVADIILTGAVPRGRALLRSRARPGDALYVTGQLGGAAAGLERLKSLVRSRATANRAIPARLRERLAPHLFPQPRIPQGLWLLHRRIATACIDLSDGLSTDLSHLCAESRVCAEVDAAALPLFPASSLQQALHGGEDYELLFTASSGTHLPRVIAGVAVTRIGRILRRRSGRPPVTLLRNGRAEELVPRGWQHFAG